MHVGNKTPPAIINTKIQISNVSLVSLLFLVTCKFNKEKIILYLFIQLQYLRTEHKDLDHHYLLYKKVYIFYLIAIHKN